MMVLQIVSVQILIHHYKLMFKNLSTVLKVRACIPEKYIWMSGPLFMSKN